MKTFEASRLSGDNRLFPDKITIDAHGITYKRGGLGGREETIPFSGIFTVGANTPLVGLSTLVLQTRAHGKLTASGFIKDDVLEMKELIQEGISGISNEGRFTSSQGVVQKMKSAEQIKAEAEVDTQRRKEEQESQAKIFDFIKKLFLGKKNKAAKELHSSLEEIEADIRIAISKGDKDEAGRLIRQLKHDSNLFVPQTTVSYSKYWSDKREDCLNKL